MNRHYPLGIVVLFASACGLSTLPPTVERAGVILQSVSDTIKSSAKVLATGLDSLAKLDPVGLNRLLRENSELRDNVMRLSARLAPAIQGRGVIEVADRAVKVRIVSHKGNHRVNGWLDSTANSFWSNRTLMDTATGQVFNLRRVIPAAFNSVFSTCGNNDCHLHEAEEAAQHHAEEVLVAYLQGPGITRGSALSSIDLNTRFGGAGAHEIIVQVIPMKGDATGHWIVIGQVYLVTDKGTEEIVDEFQYDDKLYPNYEFDKPLPVHVSLVKVKTT